MKKLRVLDLFSGIGGFSLGLERTGGFETVAFCEIDPYCQRVLAKHWPEVPIYGDVKTLVAVDIYEAQVIVGGFPCQDISVSGAGAGLDGERSGLWAYYRDIVRDVRPLYVIVENAAALLSRGLGRVLGDLAALGYDAEWECIPACAVGAPHDRDRLWLVAYPHDAGRALVFEHWSWERAEARREWPTAALDTQRGAAAWLARTAESVSPILRDDDGLPGWLAERMLGAAGNAVVPQIPELIGHAILQALDHPPHHLPDREAA